jgi:hypothetical protein
MLLLTALLTAALTAAPSAKPKLIVLELVPGGGVEPQIASALTETVATRVEARGVFAGGSATRMDRSTRCPAR